MVTEQDVLEKTNPPTFLKLFNKLNSLQIYDTAQNYKILLRVVHRLSQHNLKFWHHRHI
jgi:hypothetical protein